MSKNLSYNITDKDRKNFHELLKKSWDKAHELYKIYTQEDVRFDFFAVFSEINQWMLIQLDMLSEISQPNEQRISKYMKLSQQDKMILIYEFDKITKSAYLTESMFLTEHLIKNLMNGLHEKSSEGYFKLTKTFLSKIQFYTDQNHKILNAPAQMRNSLHNNGYASFNFEVTIQGKTYQFINGKQVRFAGLDTIFIFYSELLDLLIKIIEQPKIKKLKFIQRTSMSAKNL